jgi:hypothetical protein
MVNGGKCNYLITALAGKSEMALVCLARRRGNRGSNPVFVYR